MTPRPGRAPRSSRGLWYVAVLLATVAQLAFSLLPLVDGWRGLGAGPHVEATGATAHYAHVEETCVACHAHAVTAQSAAVVRLAVGFGQVAPIPRGRRADASVAFLTAFHRSRAPPTPI